jgi:hypothetical protein
MYVTLCHITFVLLSYIIQYYILFHSPSQSAPENTGPLEEKQQLDLLLAARLKRLETDTADLRRELKQAQQKEVSDSHNNNNKILIITINNNNNNNSNNNKKNKNNNNLHI